MEYVRTANANVGNACAGMASNLPAPTPQQQLHPALADLTMFLNNAREALQAVLNRIQGPQPLSAENTPKSDRDPSTLEYIQFAHRQIAIINLQIQQIADSIG
jgi:hypothetical protein